MKIVAVRETGCVLYGNICSRYVVYYSSGYERTYIIDTPETVKKFVKKAIASGNVHESYQGILYESEGLEDE